MKISIKTRSGKYDQEEFEELLDIYNQYPLEELIPSPKSPAGLLQKQTRLDHFLPHACRNSKNPLVYNGDIFLCGRLPNFPGEISPKQNASCSEEEF